jgi:gas vesicle protein
MMRLINFLAGFIVGMVLGGVVAALLAPQSGSETRQLFRSRVEVILEEGRRAAESSRAEAHARLADLKARGKLEG